MFISYYIIVNLTTLCYLSTDDPCINLKELFSVTRSGIETASIQHIQRIILLSPPSTIEGKCFKFVLSLITVSFDVQIPIILNSFVILRENRLYSSY